MSQEPSDNGVVEELGLLVFRLVFDIGKLAPRLLSLIVFLLVVLPWRLRKVILLTMLLFLWITLT